MTDTPAATTPADTLTILTPTQLITLRQKVLDGYEPSEAELAQVLQSLASNRSNTTRAKAATTKAAPIDLSTLFK